MTGEQLGATPMTRWHAREVCVWILEGAGRNRAGADIRWHADRLMRELDRPRLSWIGRALALAGIGNGTDEGRGIPRPSPSDCSEGTR